jgi:hypothetical protein
MNWEVSLRERLARLLDMGGDKHLAEQARQHIRDGELIEAEETIGRIELYSKAWIKAPPDRLRLPCDGLQLHSAP